MPWTRLRALHRLAPEMYDSLHSHRSWSKLLWRFLSDPSLSLYSRVIRFHTVAEVHPEPVA